MQSLKIDPEFKKWLMPLKAEEYDLLEQSILKEGCREALILWGEVLIDGHNRYSICTKHGIEFTTTSLDFDCREDVIDWIIRNQLSRRNVTPEQRDYLMGILYKENKTNWGGNRHAPASPQNDDLIKTSSKIANQFKVGKATVERAEHFADAVDKLASSCGDHIKKDILTRGIPISKKDVLTISGLSENKQREAIAKIRNGASSRRVIEESISSPKQEHKAIDNSELVSIPCANPLCTNRVIMKESQYKEHVGVYPRKYGYLCPVYCSTACAEGHTAWIEAGRGLA